MSLSHTELCTAIEFVESRKFQESSRESNIRAAGWPFQRDGTCFRERQLTKSNVVELNRSLKSNG